MYAGRVMEEARVDQLFADPKHPYTRALLEAIPQVEEKVVLKPIPGNVPEALNLPSGCPFHPRCTYASEICHSEVPSLRVLEEQHRVACHLLN